MKLNLGCGQNKLPGYVNVDREASMAPDLVMDLEAFPWPFEDDSVEKIMAKHVLEHVGGDPKVFIRIMQELYRVCRAGAEIEIWVPHPRHDNFLDDPTHVRPITPMTLSLFSKEQCEAWKRAGNSNSPLAIYANVDFRIKTWAVVVDERFRDHPNVKEMVQNWNNVAVEYQFVLEVLK